MPIESPTELYTYQRSDAHSDEYHIYSMLSHGIETQGIISYLEFHCINTQYTQVVYVSALINSDLIDG